MKNQDIEALRHVSRKLVRELGILQLNTFGSHESPQYWHALIEISKTPGITNASLGQLLLLSASTVSRLVKVFIKDQLVRREAGVDKRERRLYITEKGLAQLDKIDQYSIKKIKAAFKFLSEEDAVDIISGITRYASALEKSRMLREDLKILTLPTSRVIRKQIISMIESIQKNEFEIPITLDLNAGIIRAEQEYYYHNKLNFWYAIGSAGDTIGSIGLKRIDSQAGEIKKFFVTQKYRGTGLAQKLLYHLLQVAQAHEFKSIYLGSATDLKAAHHFYAKCGFKVIPKEQLPDNFEICSLDTEFFVGDVADLIVKIELLV